MTSLTLDPLTTAKALYPGLRATIRSAIKTAVYKEYENVVEEFIDKITQELDHRYVEKAEYVDGKLMVTYTL